MLKVRITFGGLRYLTIFVETKIETMNKLRQLLFDLTNVSEWRIVMWVKDIAWKIKDYDRLEYDYSCVLDHATCSEMSKTYYDKTTIYAINVMLVIIGNVGWVKNGGLSKMVEVLSFKYGDITLSTLVWVFDLIGISNLCLIIYIFANKC